MRVHAGVHARGCVHAHGCVHAGVHARDVCTRTCRQAQSVLCVFVGWVVMCRPIGLRVGLKGCGVPGIDMSRALGGRKGSGECMATGRGVGDGNWDPFLWDVYQASSQASSFSLLRCLFFDSSLLQRPWCSCSLRTGLPGVEGRDTARADSEWQPWRCFSVAPGLAGGW